MKRVLLPLLVLILAAVVAIPQPSIPPARASSSSPWSFRDDFNYTSISQLQAAGWTTESIAPASYYSVGNSLLTLLNDGTVGAGAGYGNIPANVSDWSVSTRVEWIGSSGTVSGYVGSLQVAVGTVGHSYDWMADGYYGHFDIGMDGRNVAVFANFAKQLNVWHVLRLDMIHGTLYGYFDGYLVGSYAEPDTTPGNTRLNSIQALASWETNNNFDWMQANNSPPQPPPSPNYPYFTISTNPTTVALQSGQSGNSTIQLQSKANFSGIVSLSATVEYGPITTQITPSSLTLSSGGSAIATLTIVSQTSTPTGSYSVIVQATSGWWYASVTLTVLVNPGPPDFSIFSSVSSLSTPPGSTRQVTVSVTSVAGFSGNVSLSTSSSAGLTSSVNPTSVNLASGTTATSFLSVTAASSTPLGSYNVSIIGTSGSKIHSVTLTVIVSYPDFTISESPTSQMIPLGSEQQTVLELESLGGFSGDVTLVATPSSRAIACWFTYTLTSSALLYVPSGGYAYQYPTCGAYGAAGSYNVTFKGTSGSISHSIILPVTLEDFTVSASPVSITSPTGNGTVALGSLSGLSGSISLTVSAPSAIAVSCPGNASLTSGATTNMYCSYTSTITGAYNVTITGSFVCSGCYYDGTDSHSVTVTVRVSQPSSPDFFVSANPSGLTMTPGSFANSTISLTSLGGFAGTVSLVSSVSPSGPSISVSPTTISLSSGGTGSSTLKLSTASTTPAGSYTITLTANGGNLAHSITVTLTISSATFTISENPTSQAIPVGSEKQTVIDVDSVNGFSGNVNLVATPSSTGVACWFAGTLTNKATLFLPAGGSAYQYPTCGAYGDAGSYSVTFTGTSGSISYSIVLPVTVMDYSISASSVSFTAGSSGSSTLSLTSLSGLSGPVTITVSAPSGLTASCISGITLSAGGTSTGSCTFTAASPGTYSVTLTGTFVCSSCYYDGTVSHSTTATVTVTSTDPPVSSSIIFGGVNVTTTGSLIISSGTVTGTLSVVATNSSSGIVLFSKTYSITNIQVVNNQARLVLNVPAGPYSLSADVSLSQNGGLWSASVMVTRQLDINRRGTVDIVDFSTLVTDYGWSLGSSRYSPAADLTGSGTINIVDVAIAVYFYGARVFY